MDGDKELIEKALDVFTNVGDTGADGIAEVIALVREHDGRRWEWLHSASTNARAWLSRNGLEGISAYDDLAAALDAIPHSAEPPAPAAESNAALKREVAMWRSEHDPCPFSLENETLRAENAAAETRIKELETEYHPPCGKPWHVVCLCHACGEKGAIAECITCKLERKLLSCVFCGFVGSDVEQLKAHSAMCEKHPIAALKSENERLENQIKRFLEAVTSKIRIETLIANRMEPKGENDGK